MSVINDVSAFSNSELISFKNIAKNHFEKFSSSFDVEKETFNEIVNSLKEVALAMVHGRNSEIENILYDKEGNIRPSDISKQIRLALCDGINILPFAEENDAQKLKQVRWLSNVMNIDMSPYKHCDAAQIDFAYKWTKIDGSKELFKLLMEDGFSQDIRNKAYNGYLNGWLDEAKALEKLNPLNSNDINNIVLDRMEGNVSSVDIEDTSVNNTVYDNDDLDLDGFIM